VRVGLGRPGEAEKRGGHACGDAECDELHEQNRARQDMTICDTGNRERLGANKVKVAVPGPRPVIKLVYPST
jgi:hypothetical protein